MFYRTGILTASLAAMIALLTAILMFLFGDFSVTGVLLWFVITFASAFSVIFFAIEFLLARPLKDIAGAIGKVNAGEATEDDAPPLSLLGRSGDVIAQFAESKQEEIDRLRKLEAFRKDFIADVSHELKTPIFAAQGFVHTLLDGAVKDKSVRKKFLKKAAKSLDGLDVLVQDLLTLSQIETGQIKMKFKNVDLYAITEDVFEQFRGKSNKKDVKLKIEGPARKVMVYADRQRISQVMTNLISNAIKHSSDEGEVVVKFTVKNKSVVTRVTDFGEGIAPEHLDRIFERFYRVDKSRSREKGGTGLGLAIVKHILEGHGSRPQVESEPGKGSSFSFKLPRAKVEHDGNGENHQSGAD